MTLHCFLLQAEERIIYHRQGYKYGLLLSAKPNGEDEIVIAKDVDKYLVSPNGEWIIVFNNISLYFRGYSASLYNLRKGFYYIIDLPGGEWSNCWWSKDSKKIYLFRSFNSNGELANILDHEFNKGWSHQGVSYDIESRKLEIIEEISDAKLFDQRNAFEKEYRTKFKTKVYSPNKIFYLFWDILYAPYSDYTRNTWRAKLFLCNENNSTKEIIFFNKGRDFQKTVKTTDFPWSPDSKSFAITYTKGGFYREIIWEIAEKIRNWSGKTKSRSTIYIVDAETLKWRKLTNGSSPFWFRDIPRVFRKNQ